MADRFVIDDTRLVISRPGFDASNPTLPNAQKVFDSNWFFGGAISEIGFMTIPRIGGTSQQSANPTGETFYYNFQRPLTYTPTALLFDCIPKGVAGRTDLAINGPFNCRWQHKTNAGTRVATPPIVENSRIGFRTPSGSYYQTNSAFVTEGGNPVYKILIVIFAV